MVQKIEFEGAYAPWVSSCVSGDQEGGGELVGNRKPQFEPLYPF